MDKVGERFIFTESWDSLEDYLVFLKEFFVYKFVEDKVPNSSVLLELGFGEGFGTKVLEKKAQRIVALDVDKKIVAYATKKYPSEKILFALYDGKKIPFKKNSFDAVVSIQVIEHVKDDLNFIDQVKRVVKDESPIILTTPNAKIRMLKNNNPWNEFHIREYSAEQLRNMLNKKFSSVELYGVTSRKEILEIEMNRIKRAAFLASLDPLKVRKLLPDSLKSFTKRMAKKVFGYGREVFDLKRFSYKDFHISKTNLDKCIDLLAICRK